MLKHSLWLDQFSTTFQFPCCFVQTQFCLYALRITNIYTCLCTCVCVRWTQISHFFLLLLIKCRINQIFVCLLMNKCWIYFQWKSSPFHSRRTNRSTNCAPFPSETRRKNQDSYKRCRKSSHTRPQRESCADKNTIECTAVEGSNSCWCCARIRFLGDLDELGREKNASSPVRCHLLGVGSFGSGRFLLLLII